MKIGVLSDTHLKRITDEFETLYKKYLADKDIVLHAGDVVSLEIVEYLGRKRFHGVRGNMDPLEVQGVLPSKKIVEVGPYRIGLIHGWGPAGGLEGRVLSQFREVDVIVFGHSHHPVNLIREGVLLFNPGTATGYSPGGHHTLGVLDLGETVRGEIIEL